MTGLLQLAASLCNMPFAAFRTEDGVTLANSDAAPLPLEERLAETAGPADGAVRRAGYAAVYFAVDGARAHVAVFDESLQIITHRQAEQLGDIAAQIAHLWEAEMLLAKCRQEHLSLERLTAQVAHEFNNVLMGMQPAVDLMRLQAGRSAQQLLRFADRIAASIHRGKRITADILRFTRPAQPAFHEVDADELLRDIADEIEPTLSERIVLRIDEPSESMPILADREQLAQVLINLAFNARDAMRPHGGTLTLGVSRAGERDGFVQFEISDTGTGIAPEDLPKIFDPFFTTKRCGSGLGLAVVSQIVSAHGGEILVDSTRGQGSTFHVFIPSVAQRVTRAHDGAAACAVRSQTQLVH